MPSHNNKLGYSKGTNCTVWGLIADTVNANYSRFLEGLTRLGKDIIMLKTSEILKDLLFLMNKLYRIWIVSEVRKGRERRLKREIGELKRQPSDKVDWKAVWAGDWGGGVCGSEPVGVPWNLQDETSPDPPPAQPLHSAFLSSKRQTTCSNRERAYLLFWSCLCNFFLDWPFVEKGQGFPTPSLLVVGWRGTEFSLLSIL